jgi:hypothetical protein
LREAIDGGSNPAAGDGTESIVVTADGAQWIVEVRDADAYHYVDRTSPDSGLVRQLGDQFLALSHENVGDRY